MYEKVPNVLPYELCKEVMKAGRRREGGETPLAISLVPLWGLHVLPLLYYSISEVGTYSFKEVLMNAVE